ncbi:MAG: hypothetical protein KDB24_07280 [Microthrixaceae bacterium]|nr:hypothetical protein [Microthrixaceae bacterium]
MYLTPRIAVACVAIVAVAAPDAGAETGHGSQQPVAEHGRTVMLTVDDPRITDIGMLATLADRGLTESGRGADAPDDDPDQGGDSAVGGAWEPPCRRTEQRSAFDAPRTAAEATELAGGLGPDVASGSFDEEVAARRQAGQAHADRARHANWAVEDALTSRADARDRLLTELLRDPIDPDAAAMAEQDLLDSIEAWRAAEQAYQDAADFRTMAGVTWQDVNRRGTDELSKLWHAVNDDGGFGGSYSSADADGTVADFFDRLADEAEAAADTLSAEADTLDDQADAAEAAGDSDEAAAKRAEAEQKRKEAREASEAAAKARAAADAERKRQAEKQKAGKKEGSADQTEVRDPNSRRVTIREVESALDWAPWLAGTPFDPTRLTIFVLVMDPAKDPTVVYPNPHDEPAPTSPTRQGHNPHDGLILILDPVVGNSADPCLELTLLVDRDETQPEPELSRPSRIDDGEPTGPLDPGGPPLR